MAGYPPAWDETERVARMVTTLSVALPVADRLAIEAAAKRSGRSVADWVRRTLAEGVAA